MLHITYIFWAMIIAAVILLIYTAGQYLLASSLSKTPWFNNLWLNSWLDYYHTNSEYILKIVSLAIPLLIVISSFYIRRRQQAKANKSFFLSFNFGRARLWSILLKWLGWLLIFMVIVVGYSFRFELAIVKERALAALIPAYQWENIQGELVVGRSGDGHFYLQAEAGDNVQLNFLVDTGASDIALTKQDARKLGFNPDNLCYTRTYKTANGLSAAAPVIIQRLTIGKKLFII